MKTKWYFGTLIVILALFGACQENLTVPNQEIVLQFSSTNISSSEVKLAITNVKEQLETIGVSKVDIREEANGRLVISYFSDSTVANVKDALSTATLAIYYASNEGNQSELPTKQTYNIDVFEITKSSDPGFGSSGKLLFELKQDYDRFSNPNVFVYATEATSVEKNVEVQVAYKQNKTIAIAINNIPHQIPECRAGPVS
ncbi:hypothetical protein [Lacinutrix sp. Bg11-31]|uniref:hypothetical protein n=1 Tax=Lacinutrix sp. Bg11-31 TaxID=2057808 RepID=UPI000C317163|nr:hypothetical protein [Lacinutrix sp. Bg11-31]AUC82278.1 hypothetical protein CW733_09115 [Lacinutrix sp. Bg11-31]